MKTFLLFVIAGLAVCLSHNHTNHTNSSAPLPARRRKNSPSVGSIINDGAKDLGSLFNQDQDDTNAEELFDWSDWGKGVVQVMKNSPIDELIVIHHNNHTNHTNHTHHHNNNTNHTHHHNNHTNHTHHHANHTNHTHHHNNHTNHTHHHSNHTNHTHHHNNHTNHTHHHNNHTNHTHHHNNHTNHTHHHSNNTNTTATLPGRRSSIVDSVVNYGAQLFRSFFNHNKGENNAEAMKTPTEGSVAVDHHRNHTNHTNNTEAHALKDRSNFLGKYLNDNNAEEQFY